jgi:hypothetical protein
MMRLILSGVYLDQDVIAVATTIKSTTIKSTTFETPMATSQWSSTGNCNIEDCSKLY